MTTEYKLEVCTGDIDSVKAAIEGGADRVELCSALEVGGITPSAGMMAMAVRMCRGKVAVHILIRPREGDFVYTPDEVSIMVNDIRAARQLGTDGVVIGALNTNGTIDIEACRLMMDAARGMSVSFHRAFDLCKNPFEALEEIIGLGCDRILTSGQAPTAIDGADLLARLGNEAKGRIILLAGSGVNPLNAMTILRESGVHELHASARSAKVSKMNFRRQDVAMGAEGADEFCRMVTDPQKVKAIKTILNNYSTR